MLNKNNGETLHFQFKFFKKGIKMGKLIFFITSVHRVKLDNFIFSFKFIVDHWNSKWFTFLFAFVVDLLVNKRFFDINQIDYLEKHFFSRIDCRYWCYLQRLIFLMIYLIFTCWLILNLLFNDGGWLIDVYERWILIRFSVWLKSIFWQI